MKICKHEATGLWVREDGAVCMPPTGCAQRRYRWTFGSKTRCGYRSVYRRGRNWLVHRLVLEAFVGPAPASRPEVDHVDRVRHNNCLSNLRWASREENMANRQCVDNCIAKYGFRSCEDKRAYSRARYRAVMGYTGIDCTKDHRRTASYDQVLATASQGADGCYILPRYLRNNCHFRKYLTLLGIAKCKWQ